MSRSFGLVKYLCNMIDSSRDSNQSQLSRAYPPSRERSAHEHIHTEVSNRLAPATTEKLVHIYSNWKAVAAAARDDELKMFTWDNE